MEFDESPRERTKLSMSQFGLMIDFMSLNPELVGGKISGKCDRVEVQEKWEELAVLLNSDGTGARKTWERWRKSWTDLKMKIKQKVGKLNSKSPYMVKLNDIERKAWKLISSAKKTDALNFNDSILKSENNHLKYNIPEGTKYVFFDFDKSEKNSCEMSPVNDVSNENDQENLQEDILQKSKLNISEESLDECNEFSENLVTVSDETMDSKSDFIYDEKMAPNHENAIIKIKPIVQKSSNFSSRKRFKGINHKLLKKRKLEEPSINTLLQKQNKLLEYIAGSITRIEKAVVSNSSQNDIKTVHENISKIAECFGSVATSLKEIVPK